jgi:hypothetical protein
MSTFLKLLPLELQDVKQLSEPNEDVKRGEHVLGKCSDDLKKLFSLSVQKMKEAKRMAFEESMADEKNEENSVKAFEIKTKAELIRTLFWVGVRDELECWDKENLWLRKGWKIVWIDTPTLNLGDIIGRFFGGG